MTQKRRSFSTEFKLEAVSLVLDKGYSYLEASRALGVGETALRRWTKQRQQERAGITPKGKATSLLWFGSLFGAGIAFLTQVALARELTPSG